MDPHHTDQGYWPNDWPGHDPAYDPDRASIDDECAGIFAEREPRSRTSVRSGHHRASDATWARARADYLAGESASVVCDRYGMRVSTLRNRAAEEGWRRQDQPEPEPVDLEAEIEAGLPDYADMAAHALIRLNRAILKGHATEAGRWMRLHRSLLDMAGKPVFLPHRGRGTAAQSAGVEGAVPQAKPNPLMDTLEAQVAEIQAMARGLANPPPSSSGLTRGSDRAAGVRPGTDPAPMAPVTDDTDPRVKPEDDARYGDGGEPDHSDGSDGSDGFLAPSPLGEGVGGEGLSGSFGVSRRTTPATACADRDRRPSSGAHAPPSPTGRRTETPADAGPISDHSDPSDGFSPPGD